MHELAITQSMLDLVLEEAKKAGATRVDRVNLVVGDMSGVVGESVEFYFGFLAKETIAREAVLSFRNVPTQARCHTCGEVSALGVQDWSCPACGNGSMEIVTGNELYVESIEVEQEKT